VEAEIFDFIGLRKLNNNGKIVGGVVFYTARVVSK
jgi:hypothetical protein